MIFLSSLPEEVRDDVRIMGAVVLGHVVDDGAPVSGTLAMLLDAWRAENHYDSMRPMRTLQRLEREHPGEPWRELWASSVLEWLDLEPHVFRMAALAVTAAQVTDIIEAEAASMRALQRALAKHEQCRSVTELAGERFRRLL